MTSSTTSEPELCGICGLSRGAHNDPRVQHAFDIEGVLRVAHREKPQTAHSVPPNLTGDVTLRLITLLRAKGVLDAKDLTVLFGNPSDARG